jgi:hypothetical protein
MDILNEFPSDFFKAQEMIGTQIVLTIARVEKTEMNDGRIKPVLRFAEDTRGLVLNVGNRTELVERFGRDTERWTGKKVTLVTRRVQGPNGPTQGIRFADLPVGEQIDDSLDDPLPENMAPKAPARKRAFK